MGGFKILYLDDNPQILQLVKATFEAEGHSVRVVTTTTAFHEAAESFQPDIVLIDFHMPGSSQLKTLELMRQPQQITGIPVPIYSRGGKVVLRDMVQTGVAPEYGLEGQRMQELVDQYFSPPPGE